MHKNKKMGETNELELDNGVQMLTATLRSNSEYTTDWQASLYLVKNFIKLPQGI